MPLLLEKFKVNLARVFDKPRQAEILDMVLDREKLENLAVTDFMELFIRSAESTTNSK